MISKQIIKLTAILILILFSTTLNAQVDSTDVNQGININFFNGYALSYKWNTSQSTNYRIYLSLNSSWSDETKDREIIYNDNPTQNFEESTASSYFSTDLSFQFLFNIISNENFNAYFGVGPNLRYKITSATFDREEDNNYNSESTFNDNTFGVGIITLVGIEAHLTSAITLFAESHLSGLKTWSSYKNTDERTYISGDYNSSSSSSDGSGWQASFQLVKVGFGVYF